MILEEIKSVLTFAAFRPDGDDAALSWSKRFAGRRSLLFNVSRSQVTWRALDRKGRLMETGTQDGEFAEVASSRAEEWRGLTEGGWCSVSINNRFIISLESNLSRRDNYQELLRTNPKAVLGSKYDRGKRYAIYHQPDAPSSLVMACDDAMVRSVEEVLRGCELRAGRICCGLFGMLEFKLAEIYQRRLADSKGSFILIALSEGSVAALVQQDGQWTDLRCRSGMVTNEGADPFLQIVGPLLAKMPQGSPVVFVHDGNDAQTAGAIMEQLSKTGAHDASGEDLLWNIIGRN